jgi:hypothetical protein
MSYIKWFEKHAKKHKDIVDAISNLSDEEIVEYFDYENMKLKHNDFCPLYAKNKKCHDVENLNCYLCACPYFRFDDDGLWQEDGKTRYSICSIDAKGKEDFVKAMSIHQGCTNCVLPHQKSFVYKVFNRDWMKIMHLCPNLDFSHFI